MLSRAELLKMREMTFEDIDPKEIQDVEKLNIDVKKSKPEKIREILESGKNPYFLKYKGITIKIGFASTNRTIEEAMQSLVQMKWYLKKSIVRLFTCAFLTKMVITGKATAYQTRGY